MLLVPLLAAFYPTADACSYASDRIEGTFPSNGDVAARDTLIRFDISGVGINTNYPIEIEQNGVAVVGIYTYQSDEANYNAQYSFKPDSLFEENDIITVRFPDHNPNDAGYSGPIEEITIQFEVGSEMTAAPQTPSFSTQRLREHHSKLDRFSDSCTVPITRSLKFKQEVPKDPMGMLQIWQTDAEGNPLSEAPWFSIHSTGDWMEERTHDWSWTASEDDPDEMCFAASVQNGAGVESELSEPYCENVRRDWIRQGGVCSSVNATSGWLLTLLGGLFGLRRRRR